MLIYKITEICYSRFCKLQQSDEEEMAVKEGRPMSRVVKPLRSGQITIPAEFRRALGIEPDSLLQLTLFQGELRIKPVSVREKAAGSPWLKELYDLFAPVREEAAAKYSEQEIDAAIDQAMKAVRSRKNA
jgi:AbrB family looped-hinge helix DNA binding protein